MRHLPWKRAIDRANALGVRVLCALFALAALCATSPVGELFAAEGCVLERKNDALRGDLLLRFALQGGLAQAPETLEQPDAAISSSLLLGDAPDAIAGAASAAAQTPGVVPAAQRLRGVPGGPEASFEARAPPRA